MSQAMTAGMRRVAFVAAVSCFSSCSVYHRDEGMGITLRPNETKEIVERQVTLRAIGEMGAGVEVGQSHHLLTLGHYVPVDSGRGLILVSVKGLEARIDGFRITRTLNPFQASTKTIPNLTNP